MTQAEQFPEYRDGARLLASTSGEIAQAVELSVVGTGRPLLLDVTCSVDDGAPVGYEVSINGRTDFGAFPCGPSTYELNGSTGQPSPEAQVVATGEAFTVHVTPMDEATFHRESGSRGTSTANPSPLAATGTLHLAVYEFLGWDEYPLPERPAELQDLLGPGADGDPGDNMEDFVVSEDDPAAPLVLHFSWPEARVGGSDLAPQDAVILQLVSQTPGKVHALIDGVAAGEAVWWDYDRHHRYLELPLDDYLAAHQPQAGDLVTLTLQPESLTGSWAAKVYDARGNN